MSNKIEKDWTTEAGLRAVVLVLCEGERRRHRCGYVEVPRGHPLHGVKYSDQTPAITREMVNDAKIGKKSAILAFTAGVDADAGESVRRSPDILFDCHGGLTYSGLTEGGYPAESDGWWFGFDCGHHGDASIDSIPTPGLELFARLFEDTEGTSVVRTLEYVSLECERLARQIVTAFRISKGGISDS